MLKQTVIIAAGALILFSGCTQKNTKTGTEEKQNSTSVEEEKSTEVKDEIKTNQESVSTFSELYSRYQALKNEDADTAEIEKQMKESIKQTVTDEVRIFTEKYLNLVLENDLEDFRVLIKTDGESTLILSKGGDFNANYHEKGLMHRYYLESLLEDKYQDCLKGNEDEKSCENRYRGDFYRFEDELLKTVQK